MVDIYLFSISILSRRELIWNNTTALLNHVFMNHALIVNHHSTYHVPMSTLKTPIQEPWLGWGALFHPSYDGVVTWSLTCAVSRLHGRVGVGVRAGGRHAHISCYLEELRFSRGPGTIQRRPSHISIVCNYKCIIMVIFIICMVIYESLLKTSQGTKEILLKTATLRRLQKRV